MNILVDGYGLQSGKSGAGGAGRYLLSLLEGLPKLGHVVRVIVALGNRNLFADLCGVDIQVVVKNDEWSLAPHFRWADVYYAPLNGLWPKFIPHKLPVVACIHDLQHNVYPHFFKAESWQGRNADYGFAIQRADRLISISEYESQNLEKFFGRKNVDIVHHSGYLAPYYDESFATDSLRSGAIPSDRYLVYPAVAWPHKNHFRLVQGFFIAKKMGLHDIRLVLTGAIEHELSQPEFLSHAKRIGLDDDLLVKGFVSDRLLAAIIKHAEALVFPSLYEGFGIPLVEAMQLGTPVITSKVTAIPEVVSDAAIYFSDPTNPFAIAKDLVSYTTNAELLRSKRQQGWTRSRQYSVEKMCSETAAVFQRAIEDKASDVCRRPIRLQAEAYTRFERKKIATLIIVYRDSLSNIDDLNRLKAHATLGQELGEVFVFLPVDADVLLMEQVESLLAKNSCKFCFFDDQRPDGLSESLRVAMKIVISAHYVILNRIRDRLKISSQLTSIIAELDLFSDIGGANVGMENESSVSVIVRPQQDGLIFRAFQALRDAPMEHFWGWVLRTKVFDEADVPGTIRFLSYFLKNISYLSVPII